MLRGKFTLTPKANVHLCEMYICLKAMMPLRHNQTPCTYKWLQNKMANLHKYKQMTHVVHPDTCGHMTHVGK